MFSKYLFIILICCPFSVKAQSWEWVQSAGGSQPDNGFGICSDDAGNCYTTLNKGFGEAKMLKFDIAGNLIWETFLWQGKVNDLAYNASGYLYAIGDSVFTPMLAKCNINGNLIWKINLDTGAINSIITDSLGNIFITGENQVLRKIDPNGNVIWNINVTDAIGKSICTDDMNNFYITGKIKDTAFFDSGVLIPQGNYDIFVAKFDTNGNNIWAKRAGGNHIGNSLTNDCGYAITSDSLGNIYFTGSMVDTAYFGSQVFYASQNDMFLAKYDSTGNVIWVRQASNGSDMEGRCIAIDQQNNILVGGSYVPSANFNGYNLSGWGNYDAFIARYDASGNFINVMNAGGSLWNEFVYDISIDDIGNTFVVGSYSQGAFFGNDTLSNLGLYDSFIAKVNLTTGLTENPTASNKLGVYPNPNNGFIDFDGIDFTEIKEISICNLDGKEVLSLSTLNNSTLNIEELNPGFYLLKMIQHNGAEAFFKIICNE